MNMKSKNNLDTNVDIKVDINTDKEHSMKQIELCTQLVENAMSIMSDHINCICENSKSGSLEDFENLKNIYIKLANLNSHQTHGTDQMSDLVIKTLNNMTSKHKGE